jgi:3'-phosphoadenosine 5'-phosphosulfate sulfotransferase (PAPS reductase)/FAD synthetase
MKSDLIISKHTRTHEQLSRLLSLPLIQKENLSKRRVGQFFIEMNGKIYIAFSGGKDSTVLLHLVRSMFPDKIVYAVFNNTGLEYPEIIEFVKTIENVIWLNPIKPFKKVLEENGFPIISKEVAQKIEEIRTTKSEKLRNKRLYGDEKGHGKLPEKWKPFLNAPFKISDKCCHYLKKGPAKAYEKQSGNHPIVGTMTEESRLRENEWLLTGCNSFSSKRPISRPLSFWTEKDIWEYIKKYNLPYSKIYDMGEKRTGCVFCLFGCQFDSEDGRQRFDRMKIHHPKYYRACEKLTIIDKLKYIDKMVGNDVLLF